MRNRNRREHASINRKSIQTCRSSLIRDHVANNVHCRDLQRQLRQETSFFQVFPSSQPCGVQVSSRARTDDAYPTCSSGLVEKRQFIRDSSELAVFVSRQSKRRAETTLHPPFNLLLPHTQLNNQIYHDSNSPWLADVTIVQFQKCCRPRQAD